MFRSLKSFEIERPGRSPKSEIRNPSVFGSSLLPCDFFQTPKFGEILLKLPKFNDLGAAGNPARRWNWPQRSTKQKARDSDLSPQTTQKEGRLGTTGTHVD